MVIEYESLPHGWAYGVFKSCAGLKNTFFICQSADKNNQGIGMPMGDPWDHSKLMMSLEAGRVISYLRRSPDIVLMTNTTNFILKGDIAPQKTPEEYVLERFRREMRLAQMRQEGGKTVVHAKIGGRSDDGFAAFLHCTNVPFVLGNHLLYKILVRPCYRPRGIEEMPPPIPTDDLFFQRLQRGM